jgi:acyl carrier protein
MQVSWSPWTAGTDRIARSAGTPGTPGTVARIARSAGTPARIARSNLKREDRRRVGSGLKKTTGEAVPAETHVEKGPPDRQEVFELIRDQLADILEIEPSSISESASFAEDLDADSLALIELVEALEEELGERSVGFRIEDEDLEELRTVRDAVDYVVAKLGAA